MHDLVTATVSRPLSITHVPKHTLYSLSPSVITHELPPSLLEFTNPSVRPNNSFASPTSSLRFTGIKEWSDPTAASLILIISGLSTAGHSETCCSRGEFYKAKPLIPYNSHQTTLERYCILKLISMKSLEFSCLNTQNFSFFSNDCCTSTDDVYKRLKHNGICLKPCITVSPLDCLWCLCSLHNSSHHGKMLDTGGIYQVSTFPSISALFSRITANLWSFSCFNLKCFGKACCVASCTFSYWHRLWVITVTCGHCSTGAHAAGSGPQTRQVHFGMKEAAQNYLWHIRIISMCLAKAKKMEKIK